MTTPAQRSTRPQSSSARKAPLRNLVCAFGWLCAAGAANAEGESEIAFSDVPQIVLDTAETVAPGVTFEKVSIEIENGVKIYEFEATTFEGKHLEVDVFENGELEEVEMEMSADELPDSVTQALYAAYPNFKPSYIEASIRGDWSTVYEIEGVTAAGEELSIDINESGDIIAVAERELR